MWQTLKESVVAPLARRVGTALGAILVSYGAQSDLTQAVEAVVVGVLLIAFDLVVSKVDKTKYRSQVLLGRR